MPADATILIAGPGGAGKTSLALAWLHQNADRYPVGQLYADLRGYSSDGPVPPGRVLGEWLRALGVAPEQIPFGLEERSTLFRSLTAGNRYAVFADNVASSTQVRPLLPGPGSLMVITTRRRLGGLLIGGANLLSVNALDESSCLELLDLIAGPERRQADTAAARSLVHACGRLPLAVCLTAATLATNPRMPIARLARDLTLPAFDTDDGAMTEILDTSYKALPDDETRRMYRLLSHHTGLDITPDAAAALAGVTVEAASLQLEQLTDARLIDEDRFRYAFHDLAFSHARATAKTYGLGDDPHGAFTRLCYWYLRMAAAAARAVIPGRWHLGRIFTEPPAEQFDEAGALAWLTAERHNLRAIVDTAHQRGLHALSWQIAEAAWPLFVRRRHYDTWIAIYEAGAKAAQTAGDLEAHARMLQGQASAFLGLRNYGHAAALADQALELARLSGHRHAEATSLEQLGLALLGRSQHAIAIDHFHAARKIYHDLDHERGAALMTRHLGEVALAAEDFGHAIELLIEAEQWCAFRPEEDYLRSRCLGRLGRAYRLVGRHEDALTALETALQLARDTRAHQQQADVLVELADLAADMDQTDLKQRHLREAHAIYTELGALDAVAITDRLLPQAP